MSLILGKVTNRDYPEDFHKDHGNCQNICLICNKTFIGFVDRMICKQCNTDKNNEE
jgi:hypothetical protein